MMRPLAIALLAVVTTAGTPLASAAQTCFRGRPLPHCRSFWLTEAEAGAVLAGRSGSGSENVRLGVELGWMRNTAARSAFGGGIAAGHEQDAYVSLRPRYRRWLRSPCAIDLSPGVRWTPGRIETIEGRVAIEWRDLAAVLRSE